MIIAPLSKKTIQGKVYDRGYLGEGKYRASKNKIHTKEYSTWKTMLARCYSESRLKASPTYNGCNVHEDWFNFQNFANWFNENYYEIPGQKTTLDKDILLKGNKIYGPDTCIFVPEDINLLFVKRNANRGECPIGVNYHKVSSKYKAECRNHSGNKKHLGLYINKEEAFRAYKKYKEQLIKQIANDYKVLIPIKLYKSLVSYEVNIND